MSTAKKGQVDSTSSPSAPDLSIRGDKVAIHPTGYTKSESNLPTTGSSSSSTSPTTLDGSEDESAVVSHSARFRQSPWDFLREISLHVSGSGWRSYDRVIGQPIFYNGFSESMKFAVMSSEMLQQKIRYLADRRVAVENEQELLKSGMGFDGNGYGDCGENGDGGSSISEKRAEERRRTTLEASLQEVAEKLVDDMICKMESKTFIRGAYYFASQLLTRAYHQGIHVSSEEVLRLRAVAEDAANRNLSIIFLPCHKSHIDYVSLQLICYRLGLALPTVVAGDNLNLPLLGHFLQHAGAMWIRRTFADDQLYISVVQAYIDTLLSHGYNFECFVEGGRSRTGKLLPPKFGILSFLLDSIMSGRVKDAIICPVSTQYDKVIEVDSYVSELLGQPKPKENLRDFLSASSVLSLKLGRVDVRFHEPWSLRGFVDEQLNRYKIQSKVSPSETQSMETRARLLRTLGYKVLSDINKVSVVMPTALIGTVLLTLRGRGVGKSELVRRVEWLTQRIRSRGGRVAHFAGLPTDVVVARGLEVLGPELVGVVQGLAEETYYAVDRFQLSFYRNMTIHLFILPALVSAGLYTKVKEGGHPEQQRITYESLKEQVDFLSQLFRGEFIFPTEGLEVNLDHTLSFLESDKVVEIIRPSHEQMEATYVQLSDTERESGRENFDFYCFLIWPFIEASWLGAISLMMLTPPLSQKKEYKLDLKTVQECAQLLGKTLYHQGDLSYFEAVNKETLKNAYQRFEEEGMIIVNASKFSKSPSTVKLSPEWMPQRDEATGALLPNGRLWDFAEMISHSRREGKNRRDGKTVKSRVISLVDQVCQKLYEQALPVEEENGTEDVEARSRRPKKARRRSIRVRASL